MSNNERAASAASQVFDDVTSAEHVSTSPSGEEIYRVRRRTSTSEVTVTLNPNGLRAGVEWRGKRSGEGYRVLRLQGLVTE